MAFQINPLVLGDNLRYYRLKSSYTPQQLAKLSLVSYQQIIATENGTYIPGSAEREKLERVLGLRGGDLTIPRPLEPEYYESC